MAQSIKLGSDTYLDASGVTVDQYGSKLSDLLALMPIRSKKFAIDGNATVTNDLKFNGFGIVICSRLSYSSTPGIYVFDQWGGVTSLGTTSGWTVTFDPNTHILSVKSNFAYYSDCIVLYAIA